jgi:hypothetical protein
MSRLDKLEFRAVVRLQQQLYERALGRTDEARLSARVIAYDAASDEGFGCDPAFPVYPAAVAARVHALPLAQHARLTRILFAMEKQNVAQNEMITLTWNSRCAIRAFGMFSDEYWVQHRETLDEHDHIYGFELLARKLLGTGLSASELERKNRFRDFTFNALDPVLKSRHAVPSLYFTLRFVANVFLKMVEGFCFDPRRTDLVYSEPLRAINQAHHDDEARHFTSSWAFGRELFASIDDPAERELVRAIITLYLSLHIRALALGGHLVRTGLESLLFAVETGALPALDLSREALVAAYANHRDFVDLAPSRRRESFRWAASQFRKLETSLEIGPRDYALEGLRPENRALLEQIHQAILANGSGPDDDLPFEPCYQVYRAMSGEASACD